MYIPAYVLQPDYGGTCETSYSLICSTAYFILTWLLIYMLQQLGYLLQQSPPGSAPVSSVPASCLCHCLPFDLYSTRTLSELVLVQYIPKSRLSKSVVIQPCCLSSVFATGAHHYLHTLQTTGGIRSSPNILSLWVGKGSSLTPNHSLPTCDLADYDGKFEHIESCTYSRKIQNNVQVERVHKAILKDT